MNAWLLPAGPVRYANPTNYWQCIPPLSIHVMKLEHRFNSQSITLRRRPQNDGGHCFFFGFPARKASQIHAQRFNDRSLVFALFPSLLFRYTISALCENDTIRHHLPQKFEVSAQVRKKELLHNMSTTTDIARLQPAKGKSPLAGSNRGPQDSG